MAIAASSRLRDLKGRTALITGASRGIGCGIALTLAKAATHDLVINYAGNESAAARWMIESDPHPEFPRAVVNVTSISAYIASGAFPYSTGEVINVDGGFHLRVL